MSILQKLVVSTLQIEAIYNFMTQMTQMTMVVSTLQIEAIYNVFRWNCYIAYVSGS